MWIVCPACNGSREYLNRVCIVCNGTGTHHVSDELVNLIIKNEVAMSDDRRSKTS